MDNLIINRKNKYQKKQADCSLFFLITSIFQNNFILKAQLYAPEYERFHFNDMKMQGEPDNIKQEISAKNFNRPERTKLPAELKNRKT